MTKLNPNHPGRLVEDVLEALAISPSTLAKAIKVSPSTVSRIVRGQMSVSADLALRLEKSLNIDARLLIDMQAAYDLRQAEIEAQNSDLLFSLPNLVHDPRPVTKP
ncbi:HigA family addiction module antitoxin [uncultured Parasutterella sp.]|uniref:HigA family addiction module antitoxin n=1 Tax=uncultured Parasutterella sp. TaxID=1263098 RepID=UPI002597884F|nr:HigA family addiction module antitoxin [uncultured Parasutterella sp.]